MIRRLWSLNPGAREPELAAWIDREVLLDAWVTERGLTVRLHGLRRPLESLGYAVIATGRNGSFEMTRVVLRQGDEFGSLQPGTEVTVLSTEARRVTAGRVASVTPRGRAGHRALHAR